MTPHEEQLDRATGHLRFDIELLGMRLEAASTWARSQAALFSLPLGYFGASTGAAAALKAAASRTDVQAVVSRGGRPDLAGKALPRVTAPTLLIVGGDDREVISLNQEAYEVLGSQVKEIEIVPHASHLFSEPGALEQVADRADAWFVRHFGNLPRLNH